MIYDFKMIDYVCSDNDEKKAVCFDKMTDK